MSKSYECPEHGEFSEDEYNTKESSIKTVHCPECDWVIGEIEDYEPPWWMVAPRK